MKKVLKIIFLGLLLSLPLASISQAADPFIGTGEIKLSYNVIRNFKEYVRNINKKPSVFIITADGPGCYYIYCPHGQCQPPSKQ